MCRCNFRGIEVEVVCLIGDILAVRKSLTVSKVKKTDNPIATANDDDPYATMRIRMKSDP